jgi:hypothetical protein
MRLLLGREPTVKELRDGIPPLHTIYGEETDLGLIPLLLAAAPVVLGGAWGLSSVFGYMTERERTAQTELEEQASLLDTARAWALPAALAVGVGSLGYIWITKRRKKKTPAAAQPVTKEESFKNEADNSEDLDAEEDFAEEDFTEIEPYTSEPDEEE